MAGADSLTGKYEFLDHTADVQIHSWGDNLRELFENSALAMMAYITDVKKVEIVQKESITVCGDDLQSLFYKFLDEVLYLFNAEPYLISKRVRILEFSDFSVRAECYGEPFSMEKHEQGTEIKAITYSSMEIIENAERCDAFFIVDI